MNSILNQDWIRPIDHKKAFIVLAGLLGAAIAIKINSIGLAMILLLGVLLGFVSACIFAYKGILVPLLYPVVACGPLVTIFIEKQESQKKGSIYSKCWNGSIRRRNSKRYREIPIA